MFKTLNEHGSYLFEIHREIKKCPRRGSNAQPPDSKSVTLSIELRGQSIQSGKYNQWVRFLICPISPMLSLTQIFAMGQRGDAGRKVFSVAPFYQSLSKKLVNVIAFLIGQAGVQRRRNHTPEKRTLKLCFVCIMEPALHAATQAEVKLDHCPDS